MKRLIVCAIAAISMAGMCVTAEAREVTTLDMDCGSCIEDIEVIQGVVELAETEPEITESAEPEAVEAEQEETTEAEFTGNYGRSDEDEWVDMDDYDCPEHIWSYEYDEEGEEIAYFCFCLNCGLTEYLDYCPEELEYTLPGYEEEIDDSEETDIEDSES